MIKLYKTEDKMNIYSRKNKAGKTLAGSGSP